MNKTYRNIAALFTLSVIPILVTFNINRLFGRKKKPSADDLSVTDLDKEGLYKPDSFRTEFGSILRSEEDPKISLGNLNDLIEVAEKDKPVKSAVSRMLRLDLLRATGEQIPKTHEDV